MHTFLERLVSHRKQYYMQACSISLGLPHDRVNSVHAPINREIDDLDDDYEKV
jgi:hypothetical protein